MAISLHDRITARLDPLAEDQCFIVGSNTLPVLVTALALRPRQTHLIYGSDVLPRYQRLCEELDCAGLVVGKSFELKDPRSAADIQRDLQSLPEMSRVGLHYSGGTKVMAVHVRRCWIEKGGDPRQASYLGSDGWLRFDDGPEFDLRREPTVSLDTLGYLHLGVRESDPHPKIESKNRHRDAAALSAVKGKLPAAFRHDDLRPIRGPDLEVWLADQLVEMKVFDHVYQSVTFYPKEHFEVDVLALRGHRAFVFSCAARRDEVVNTCKDCGRQETDRTSLKKRLFEARLRADALGGDHARAALVSFSKEPASVLRTIRENGWLGYEDARCFGLEHLRGQAQACSVEMNLEDGPMETLQDGVLNWVKS